MFSSPFAGFGQPSAGANTSSSYSYSYGGSKPAGPSYNDPFAKPSVPGYGAPTSTTQYGGYGAGSGLGGLGGLGSFGSYGNYGGYSNPAATSVNVKPTNIVPNVGITSNIGLGGYGGAGATSYGNSTNYGGYGNYGNYGAPSAPSNVPAQTSYKPYTPSVVPQVQVQVPIQLPQVPQYNPAAKPGQSQLTVGEINDLSKAGKQLFSNAFAKSSTKSAFQDLFNQLKASGQKYKDLDFAPEIRSLTGGLSDYELQQSGNSLNWRSLIWLRPDEFYGKGNYKIFQGDIEPADIKQGALGDCYFLSTIAAIAEVPARIRILFESEDANEQGVYGVKICDMGVWQTIILDDFFPCSAKSKQPIFSKGNGNELWVLLLEKAWSKIYGSYARIESGLTRECLHDLTGAPTKYFLTGDPSKNEEIWHAILHGEQKNFIMTAGAGDFFEGADLMNSIGLVGSHAYSLLGARVVKDRYGKEVRLVQLRNPWGKGEWTGDWSDESPTWTEDLKRQVGLQGSDDGIFYMSFPDMLKYFSDIQVCKIHDDFKYKSLKASADHRHATFFKVTVRVPGHYYLTVNQESKRKHAESENYEYSEVYLVMGKKVGNGYEYVEGCQKADKEVWTDGKLTAGEYIVYAKVAWNEKRTREFSLSAYGEGEVGIEVVPSSYCSDFIEKVYTSKGRLAQKKDDYKHCGVTNCYRTVELTDDGFGFIYYKNESNKTLDEELYFKALEGLKFKKPYRGNSYKIQVPPGQEKIVITKIIPNAPRIRQAFTERSRFI